MKHTHMLSRQSFFESSFLEKRQCFFEEEHNADDFKSLEKWENQNGIDTNGKTPEQLQQEIQTLVETAHSGAKNAMQKNALQAMKLLQNMDLTFKDRPEIKNMAAKYEKELEDVREGFNKGVDFLKQTKSPGYKFGDIGAQTPVLSASERSKYQEYASLTQKSQKEFDENTNLEEIVTQKDVEKARDALISDFKEESETLAKKALDFAQSSLDKRETVRKSDFKEAVIKKLGNYIREQQANIHWEDSDKFRVESNGNIKIDLDGWFIAREGDATLNLTKENIRSYGFQSSEEAANFLNANSVFQEIKKRVGSEKGANKEEYSSEIKKLMEIDTKLGDLVPKEKTVTAYQEAMNTFAKENNVDLGGDGRMNDLALTGIVDQSTTKAIQFIKDWVKTGPQKKDIKYRKTDENAKDRGIVAGKTDIDMRNAQSVGREKADEIYEQNADALLKLFSSSIDGLTNPLKDIIRLSGNDIRINNEPGTRVWVKKMQEHFGIGEDCNPKVDCKADGKWGPNTTKAFNKAYNGQFEIKNGKLNIIEKSS